MDIWVSPALMGPADNLAAGLEVLLNALGFFVFKDAFSWPWASSLVSLALFKIPTGL